MSEKRVNIRITASTSDFDKAIKNAQQQIEKLADTIDNMGKGKFGDNLEKQLESVTDAAKKMQKQLEEMQESLDDMNKSKVDKLEKKLDDVSDSAEDLNEELEDTTDTLEDMNKAKVDKLEKQFEDTKKTAETLDEKLEDVIDSLKDIDDLDIDNVTKSFEDVIDANQDLKRRIDELLDNFDELDSQDLNRLENEFEQVETSIRNLGDEIRKTTDDLNKYIEDITNETNDLDNAIDDIDGDGFNRIKETVQELDEYIDEMTDSTKDFNKEAGELDTSGIDRYADAMKGITGADGSINIDGDSSNKGNKDGLLDNVSDSLMSGVIAGNIMADTMEDVADSIKDVAKNMEHFQDVADDDIDKSIDDLGEEYREAQSSLEKLTEEYDDLIKKQKELNDNKADMESRNNQYKQEIQPAIDDYKQAQKLMEQHRKDFADVYQQQEKDIRDYNQEMEEHKQQTLENNEAIEKQEQVLDDLGKTIEANKDKFEAYSKTMNDLEDSYQNLFIAAQKAREAGNEDFANSLEKQWQQVAEALAETKEEYDKLEKAIENANNKWTEENSNLDGLKERQEELREAAKLLEQMNKALSEQQGKIDKKAKEFEELEKRAEGVAEAIKKIKDVDITQDEELEKLEKEIQETEEAAEGLTDEIDNVANKMAELNKVAQGHADEFDKQYKAYEKLSKQIEEYISDESKADILRKETAESFRDAANAMEAMYAGAKKLNNMDQVNKTLEETKDCLKEVSLVDFDGVMNELDKFNKRIEDTIDKQKRYKETSKHFGTDDGNKAYSLQMQAKALKEWADSADFVIEASNTLTHAWGNLSAAGEDNLKIRERSKYIDDYGKTLEENIAHIKNYYYELQTLDEIYEECTDKQRAIIDDYKAWEKNKEKLEEYNQAIRDYLIAIKDSGGQISDKFKNDSGNFDPKKFIENYEKFGEQSATLKRSQEALKVKILATVESLIKNAEASEKAAKEAVKHAEAVRDQAKAQKAAANSEEERIEAAKKLADAEEELAEAKKKLSNFDKDLLENLDKLIKKFDEGSEKARQLGINMKDIAKIDISNIDGGKPFASLLDNMETFGSNIPKTMSELNRQIEAVFADMDSLDFGDALSGLKDIGAGILGKLPTELKMAATAAVALAAGLKECAEIGINQFSKGMDTISNALSGIVGVARDVGQELTSAFENITGMDMDLSSLIEIPINFESQMKRVGAIAGVTGEEFEELEKKARELGATTRYSATEVGEAMEYMGMAGWDNKEILAGLESVLNLATVADMSLGDASDFVTDALTALGMEAKDASKMVDILATVSVKSNTSVAQMQKAFTNCASVAGSFKIPLEDLAMALGLMANQGVKGAKAGTAMKNLMTELNNPTEKQLAALKKYNLLGARQAIVNGDLIGGIKELKQGLDGLSESEKNQVIEILFGKESLNGISALLNTTTTDIAELEAAIKDCDGSAAEMAKNFDDSLKGALLNLSSAMEETLLQIFDKIQDGIKNTVNELTGFFNILNGMGQPEGYEAFSGLADALAYLEDVSEGWGEAIAEGLASGIAAIDNFVNGGALDSLLQVGTNIINGICDGIQTAADNGTLDSAISGAIRRIATWFSDNLDTVVEVGKEIIEAISDGISENSDVIGDVIISVIEMQTTIDNAIAKEKWKLIGSNLATFICEGFASKIETFFAGVGGFLEGLFTGNGGVTNNKPDDGNILDTSKDYQNWTYKDPITGNTYGPGVKNGKDYADGVKDGVKSKKEDVGNTVNQNFKDAKVKTDTTASEIGQGISDNIVKKLETMDTGDLKELRTELENLQTTVQSVATAMSTSFTTIQDASRTSFMGLTNIVRNQMVNCTNIMRNQMINSANIVRNQCVNMANIFRNQFVSMSNVSRNQMINVSNIIRNQSVNWSNIIRNQITNARNAFTRQMMSMAAVARTQMINVSNILRNQSKSWYNIINNQAKNARNAFTSQMISMAKVAATQMGKVTSSIRSAMSQASRGISLNVNRNVTTSYAAAAGGSRALSADALYAANNASTLSLGGNMGALNSSASYAMSTGGGRTSGGSSMNDNVTLEIPIMLDGRELARASAKYVDNELKLMTKRENRKRGAK